MDALGAVAERAREAVTLIPAETRTAKEDGTTRYMRPRPGAARMYPETDIPPTLITSELVEKIRLNLPESAEKKLQRLKAKHSLNEKLAKQIVDSEYNSLFENIVKESGVSATTVAVFLTESLKALKRDGIQVENVSDEQVKSIFEHISSGELTKEAAPEVFAWLSKQKKPPPRKGEISIPQGHRVWDAIDALGLKMLSPEELERFVDKVIAENHQSIEKLGKNAFGLVMGLVMKETRGKTSPEKVSQLVKQKLK
jgi:glutamyl-tRNA(Gln) amidotransferase subunit E